MSKFHLSDNGPAPCNATVRECPIGGDHFDDEREAERAFKVKNNLDTFNSKSKGVKPLGSVSPSEYSEWRNLSEKLYISGGALQEKLNEQRSFERYEESGAGLIKKFLKHKEFEREIPLLREKNNITRNNLNNYEQELINSRKTSDDDPIVMNVLQNGVELKRQGSIEHHVPPKTPQAEEILKLGKSINPEYRDFPITAGGDTEFSWSMKNAGEAAFERTHTKLLGEGVWDKSETEEYIKELGKLYRPNVTTTINKFYNGEVKELIREAEAGLDRAEKLGK